jgi:hypothetical protein
MSNPGHEERRHESVWLLLPWYANATLGAQERLDVEEHVALCERCAEELGRCESLGAALRAGDDSAPTPHPIQLARLMERIEASEGHARLTAESPSLRKAPSSTARRWRPAGSARRHSAASPAAGLLADTPRPVRYVLAGQLAALVLLATVVSLGSWRPWHAGGSAPRGGSAAQYRTLSAPAEVGATGDAAAAGDAAARPRIRVVFTEGATEKQLREVLLRIGGRLIDGPSPLGTYTLETAPAANPSSRARAGVPQDSPSWVLAYLRAQPIVRFAEPVAGWPGTASTAGAPASGREESATTARKP